MRLGSVVEVGTAEVPMVAATVVVGLSACPGELTAGSWVMGEQAVEATVTAGLREAGGWWEAVVTGESAATVEAGRVAGWEDFSVIMRVAARAEGRARTLLQLPSLPAAWWRRVVVASTPQSDTRGS